MSSGIFGELVNPLDQNQAGIFGDDALGVGHDHRGGVGIGSIDDDLNRGSRALPELPGETVVDLQGGADPSLVDPAADFAGICGLRGDAEIPGGGEMVDQSPGSPGSVVQVIDGQGNVADVGVGRIPEDHQLHDRGEEKDDAHPRVCERPG